MPENNIAALAKDTALLAIARNAFAGEGERPPVLHVIRSESTTLSADEKLADFGYTTDAANFLLASAECPPEHRPFIDALIGVAAESTDWFIASDKRIALRAGRSTKTVQRWRDAFDGWQKATSQTLVEIENNFTDGEGKHHPHKYKVHVARLAVEATEEARRSSRWSSNPAQAIARAAREKRKEIPDVTSRRARGRKREPDAETTIKAKLRMASTLIEQAARLAEGVKLHKEMFGSAADFELDPELIARLRHSVEQLESKPAVEAPTSMSTSSNIKKMDIGNTGGGVGAGGQNVHLSDADRAVDVFESVGASMFGVTLRDEPACKAADFEYVTNLTKHLPKYLSRNAISMESVIVRPQGAPFIQLDDLSAEARARVEPFSFLSIEPSEELYQAWVALSSEAERDATRRRLVDWVGADRGASGALRWPGSVNHKPGRNGFKVRVIHTTPGRVATTAELEAAGLPPPVSPIPPLPAPRSRVERAPRTWPDYQRCLNEAKRKASGGPDRSEADKNWCILARGRGWPELEIESKLREVSDKAKRRPDYARRTVAYAVGIAGGH